MLEPLRINVKDGPCGVAGCGELGRELLKFVYWIVETVVKFFYELVCKSIEVASIIIKLVLRIIKVFSYSNCMCFY